MDRRRFLEYGSIAGTVLLVGCLESATGGQTDTDDGGGDGTNGSDDSTVTVTMANTAFDPVRATASVEDTVEWVNEDEAAHSVVATDLTGNGADWSFESDDLEMGETATYTFESDGVYEYYCDIHGEATMCGAVVVGDASLDGSLPCASGEDGGGDDGGGGGYYSRSR